MALLSGEPPVLKEGSDDAEHAIAVIKPGTSIGEMAMIDGESRSATIVMSKDSQILMLDEDDFQRCTRTIFTYGRCYTVSCQTP